MTQSTTSQATFQTFPYPPRAIRTFSTSHQIPICGTYKSNQDQISSLLTSPIPTHKPYSPIIYQWAHTWNHLKASPNLYISGNSKNFENRRGPCGCSLVLVGFDSALWPPLGTSHLSTLVKNQTSSHILTWPNLPPIMPFLRPLPTPPGQFEPFLPHIRSLDVALINQIKTKYPHFWPLLYPPTSHIHPSFINELTHETTLKPPRIYTYKEIPKLKKKVLVGAA